MKSNETFKDMFKKTGLIGMLLISSAVLVFIAGLVALIDTFVKNM